MSKTVFVQSVERESAVKLHEFRNDSSGKKINKSKMGDCKTTLVAMYSPKVGGLANYISYTP